MRMQVILDSLFARPGSAPIWGGKEGEFRDWTTSVSDASICKCKPLTSEKRVKVIPLRLFYYQTFFKLGVINIHDTKIKKMQ